MNADRPSPNLSHIYVTHWQTGALLALLLAGFAWLRIATGHYGFWIDEYYTLMFADEPLSHLWSGWMVRETNPPLFYTMVKGWQAVGFRSLAQLRLLPELGGLLGLFLLGAAAWIGWGLRATVPAVVLAGLSAQHVHASQLLRGYIFAADGVMIACIGLLLVSCYNPVNNHRLHLKGWFLYVTGSVLAIYFHTTMLLWPVVATLALPFAAGRHWWIPLRGILFANCFIILLSGWWLWITLSQLKEHAETVDWIVRLSRRQFTWMLSQNMFLVNEVRPADHHLSKLMALAAVGGAVGTISQPATRLIFASAIFGVAIMAVAQFIHPIVTPITLFWLSSFVVLLISGGLGAIRQPWLAGGLLLLLAGSLGANLGLRGPRVTQEDFTNAIHMAAAHPNAALLVEGPGSGATAAKACAVEYQDRPCPVHIVTIMQPMPRMPWYLEQAPNRVSGTMVRAALACCKSVYALRHATNDPLARFGIVSPESAWDIRRPFPEGPFSAGLFSAERYRAPAVHQASTSGDH